MIDPTPPPADPWPAWQTDLLPLLRPQMTQATYETVIQETTACRTDHHITILAPTEMVKDWLENRLRPTLHTTLTRFLGQEVNLSFGLTPASAPLPAPEKSGLTPDAGWFGHISLDLLAFDAFKYGYSPNAHYIQQFWGAYLGAPALQLIHYVRSFYKEPRYLPDKSKKYALNPNWQPWTPARTFSASELARKLKVSRQRVTGMERTCHRYDAAYRAGDIWPTCQPTPKCGLHQGQMVTARPSDAYPEGRTVCRYRWPGLLDLLGTEEIGLIEKEGDPEKIATITFSIQVFQPLPLLTPWQVAHLPEPVRFSHREFLSDCRLNLAQWEAIEAKRLMPYVLRFQQSLFSQEF